MLRFSGVKGFIEKLAAGRFPLTPVFLGALAVACGIAVGSLPPPWEGSVFDDAVPRREIPLRQFTTAGLWIGLSGAGLIALLLAVTWKLWGGGRMPAMPAIGSARGPRWFAPLLGVVVALAVVQRWPAMDHSLWGDESWAFCDYVHGDWRPVTKGGDIQGPIRFRQVDWEQTVFGDQQGNNHWLFTLSQRVLLNGWQRVASREVWEFDERVARLVPFMAGLGSLIALAAFLRSLGRPLEGLVAAMFMEFHPWHIRYSAEGRGYTLMLLFFILATWTGLKAARSGSLRHWLAFGFLQFLVMYSWKGALYPLAFLNLVLGALALAGKGPAEVPRRARLARWMAANLVGAMLFLPLAASSQLQVRRSIDEVRQRARPMELHWAANTASEALLGMPYFEEDRENPREVSLQRYSRSTVFPLAMAGVIVVLLVLGMGRLWLRDRALGAVCLGICLAAVAAALHFKFGVKVELLPWYLFFCLPAWAILVAFAVSPGRGFSIGQLAGRGFVTAAGRSAWAPAALIFFAGFETPMARDLMRHPKEDFRGAWAASRLRHEPAGYAGPSRVYTAWLWRYAEAYDPRGDIHVREIATLEAKMDAASRAGGEFYLIVGHPDLSELLNHELLSVLRDPTRFELVATLWGSERIHTLRVYRMVTGREGGSPESTARNPVAIPVEKPK